jgi:hypothetical protein
MQPDDSEVKNQKNEKQESIDYDSRICALVDFYSNRAVAHASFFIASIFGLITFSAIIQQLEGKNIAWFSTVLFLGFSYVGYYTLIRFGYYAILAEELTKVGLKRDEILSKVRDPKVPDPKDKKSNFLQFLDREEKSQGKLLFSKTILSTFNERSKLILGLLYWIAVTWLGIIVYSKFWDSILNWTIWLGLSWALILIFVVFLPNILWKCILSR